MYSVLLKTLSIFLIIGFGYVLRRRGVIDAAFNRMLAMVLMNVFYPALIFSSLTRRFTIGAVIENGMLPVGSFLILFCGWCVGLAVCRAWRSGSFARKRMFHFQCASNNYSFLPLMLASMLWGEAEMDWVIFSTLGAEVFIWTFGIQAITGHPVRLRSLRHLGSMPMAAMAAAFVAIALRDWATARGMAPLGGGTAGGPLLEMLRDTLRLTGQATIPVSAIVAGSRMGGLHPKHLVDKAVAALTLLRLIVIPALALGLLWLLPLDPEVYRILAIVAVMPCSLTSVTLAEVYRADADFAAATVQTTHLVCLLTIPLWLRLLGAA